MTGMRDDADARTAVAAIVAGAICLCGSLSAISPPQAAAVESHHAPRIVAQSLVEGALTAHPEATTLEIATTPPRSTKCVTIASTEVAGVGEACDSDEFTAFRSGKPFVEREREGGKNVYDVTLPLHDAQGRIIAVAGIGLQPKPGQTEAVAVARAQRIARDLERHIPTKAALFHPAPSCDTRGRARGPVCSDTP